MEPVEVLLLGLSIAIFGFVIFSLVKQYRYATQIFDMVRLYPFLIVASYLIAVYATWNWFEFLVAMWLRFIGFLIILPLIPYSMIWWSDYSFARFKELLEGLKSEAFSIISLDDYVEGHIDPERVNVCLRHDVDISLSRTVKMSEIEKKYGIHSTYFFRLHAEKYSFEEARPIVAHLAESGFRIGLHYETLSVAKGNKQEAIELLKSDIEKLREIAPVSAVAAHGQKHYKNRTIWDSVDKIALKVSSAYDMKYDMYLSDAGGKRLSRLGSNYLFDRIYEAKPGQIVQVLIHPDWWN
ncbi:MAG: hypothetical protein ACFFE2_06475 [Candidatus Thorarchaeota archaeon]